MVDETDHTACVRAWLERRADARPRERLLESLEKAFDAMWRRAHLTLGEVTLTAITERVLYNAAEKYPVLSSLRLVDARLRCHALSETPLDQRDLEAAVRFFLVEFLTVLGNLTAEVLTPALHAELARLEDAKS